MFQVNAPWDKSKGEIISPKMPKKCCHCLRDATSTVHVEENGISLEVPYCKAHVNMAQQYYDEYYNSPKRRYVKYASWLLAPTAAIIFIFAAVPGSNLITGQDELVKMFSDSLHIAYEADNPVDYDAIPFWIKGLATAILTFILLHVIPYVLDKWIILHKGAHKLGFWKDRYVTYIVPGLTELKREKEKEGSSTINYSISFSTRNYYDLFKKENNMD